MGPRQSPAVSAGRLAAAGQLPGAQTGRHGTHATVDATVILIEDRASGTPLLQELQAEGLSAVTAIQPVGDKVMRLHAQTAVIEQGRVWLPHEASWLEPLLHELTTFPKSAYDDQVDSVAQALAWMTQAELTPQPGVFVF